MTSSLDFVNPVTAVTIGSDFQQVWVIPAEGEQSRHPLIVASPGPKWTSAQWNTHDLTTQPSPPPEPEEGTTVAVIPGDAAYIGFPTSLYVLTYDDESHVWSPTDLTSVARRGPDERPYPPLTRSTGIGVICVNRLVYVYILGVTPEQDGAVPRLMQFAQIAGSDDQWSWSDLNDALGPDVPFAPRSFAVLTDSTDAPRIFFIDSTQRLREFVLATKQNQPLNATDISGAAIAATKEADGALEVYYTSGDAFGLNYDGQNWEQSPENLTQDLPDHATPTSHSPIAAVSGYRCYYVGKDAGVWEIAGGPGNWTPTGVTQQSGAVNVKIGEDGFPATGLAATMTSSGPCVYYVDANDSLTQLFRDPDNSNIWTRRVIASLSASVAVPAGA